MNSNSSSSFASSSAGENSSRGESNEEEDKANLDEKSLEVALEALRKAEDVMNSSEDEDDDEEADAIEASLVLQIVSASEDGGPANVKVNVRITPTVSRKNSFRNNRVAQNYSPINIQVSS